MKEFIKALIFLFGAFSVMIIGAFGGQMLADALGLRHDTITFISGLGWGSFVGIVIWEIRNNQLTNE